MFRITIETLAPAGTEGGAGREAATVIEAPAAARGEREGGDADAVARAAVSGALSGGRAPERPPDTASAPGFAPMGPESPATPSAEPMMTGADQPAGAAPSDPSAPGGMGEAS